MVDRVVTREEVEDFLFVDALLLDEWRLDDWIANYEAGARFEVPTTDWKLKGGGWSAGEAGYFVADDWSLLQARVKRLKSRKAHAENPHSHTSRIVSNVRILGQEGDELRVQANFLIMRYRDKHAFTYAGRYDHLLAVTESGLRFRLRRSILANEKMTDGARLSFIL